MVRGVKYWDSKQVFYSQENNPTEAYNKSRLNDRGGWLESCGPTSAVNCIAAMGKNVEITCPGSYKPQPEEVLMDYLNDPRNADKLRSVRDMGSTDIPENRVPQYYPVAVYEVFGVRGRFEWGASWDEITMDIRRGRAVMLTLKDPSHYVAVVAYDDSKRELIYNDSWGSRFSDGKGGRLRRLGTSELRTNVKSYRVIFGV